MNLTGPRVLILAAIAAEIGFVAWRVLDLPPPMAIVLFGPAPGGGPLSRRTVAGIEFVEITPGCFRMGSHDQCKKGDRLGVLGAPFRLKLGRMSRHDGDECPPHWVLFRRPYFISVTEVTEDQFGHTGHQFPAELGFLEAVRFCERLSAETGRRIRLPSEAEWERACRAGSRGRWCFGNDVRLLPDYAWFRDNSARVVHEVGTRRPNAWGLFDMHGNVSEWCSDTYGLNYDGAPIDGSRGKGNWFGNVTRGGSLMSSAGRCTSSYREGHPFLSGIRLVLEAE